MADPPGFYGYPTFGSGGGGNSNSIAAGTGLTSTTNGSTQTLSASGPYVTWYSEPGIANSRGILAGNNVTFFNDGTNITLSAQVTGSGATSSGSYLTAITEASLAQSRVATQGNGITISDGGAGGNMTFAVSTAVLGASLLVFATGDTILTGKKLLKAGTNVTLATDSTSVQINASGGGGSGTVTSVDFAAPNIFSVSGNPITNSGTITLSLVAQGSGKFLGGPTSGADANPSFRALVEGDIPQLSLSKITNAAPADAFYITTASNGTLTNERTFVAAGGLTQQDNGTTFTVSSSALQPLDATLTALAAYNTNGFVIQTAPDTFVGRGLSVAGGLTMQDTGTNILISASGVSGGGGGTVTSVSVGNLAPIFTSNVGDPTGAASVTYSLANAPQNAFLAGPSAGGAGAPWYRSIQTVDLPASIQSLPGEAYVTLGNTSGLTNERALTVAGGLTIQDNGPNSTVVVSASALQPLNTNLTALGALNSTGFIQQTGAGTFSERTITVAGGLNIQDTGTSILISSSSVAGTVTSVAQSVPASIMSVSGSPITSSGTLSISLLTQPSGLVWAGPSSGADATPTFRALVANDIPNLSTSKLTSGTLPIARGGTETTTAPTNGQLLIGNAGGTYTVASITAGTGVQVTNGNGTITVAASGALGGTVTSVGISGPSIISWANSPVTASGTLTGTLVNQSSGLALMGPASGAATTPTFRKLTYLDLPIDAGTNVTFTPSNDRITISASGGGGGGLTYSALSANASASVGVVYGCNTASASMTLYLPASPTAGQEVYIKHRVSGNTLTVVPYQGTIDGLSSVTSTTLYDAYHLIYDGSGWMVI